MPDKQKNPEKAGSSLVGLSDLCDTLEILYAVELLEYHNMNWLALDNKKRSQKKQSLIRMALINLSSEQCKHKIKRIKNESK